MFLSVQADKKAGYIDSSIRAIFSLLMKFYVTGFEFQSRILYLQLSSNRITWILG